MLFLIPLPWWGPVLAPVCIAVLMIVWGTLATRSSEWTCRTRTSRKHCGACIGVGLALALYVFMADALRAVSRGLDVTDAVPVAFNWPLFGAALALMVVPVAHAAWRMRARRPRRAEAGSLAVG